MCFSPSFSICYFLVSINFFIHHLSIFTIQNPTIVKIKLDAILELAPLLEPI